MFSRTDLHILPLLAALVTSIVLVLTAGCGPHRKISPEMQLQTRELKERGLKALNEREFAMAGMIADTLLRLAGKDPANTDAEIYGKIIKGQAIMYTDSFARCYPLLHEAVALCEHHRNDSALASAYNGLGIYALSIEKDNGEALRHFFKGIEAARRSGNEHLLSLLLCNVTSVYYIARDPDGLSYGYECLDRGKTKNEANLRCIGGMTVAFSHMEAQDYDRALAETKEAERVMLAHDVKEGATLYCLYGMILRRMGRADEAAEAFRKSIDLYNAGADDIGDIRSFTELGELLAGEGRYGEAIGILEAGMKYNDLGNETTYRGELLGALADVNRLAGHPDKAREYENLRDWERVSIQNHEKEIANVQLRSKYDLERVENEVNRQRVEILEKRNQIYALALIVGIGLCLLVSIVILYRHKSRLYSAIVRQMTESVREETRLRDTIRTLEAQLHAKTDREEYVPSMTIDPSFPYATSEETIPYGTTEADAEADTAIDAPTGTSEATTPPSYSAISAAEEKHKEEPDDTSDDSTETEPEEENGRDSDNIPPQIYRRLQAEMERALSDPAIFTDNLLTKDRLAKKLGTNRTYLSRFVNAHYKMTFTQLINSLRIKEAIRILSDPESEIPLKNVGDHVGFNSHSTFYAKFSEATGMTPAAFRTRAKNMT